MKLKKLASFVLAGAMVLGLAGIAPPVQAATTTTSSTTVSLTVDSAPYTITIPTALTVSKTGWNPIDTGIKAEGSSFPENSKLTVTATSQYGWNLYLDATHKIGYTLKEKESDTSATTSWEFTSAELRASGGKTVTAGVAVNDYSSAAPGTYRDVVTFKAEVTDLSVAVTGVSLNKTSAALTVGGEETLTATVAPENATNKAVTWASDNTSIATVDSNGKVTAVAAGTANITATSSADSTKSATCAITVSAATVAVTGVTLNKTSTTLTAGGEETLTATVAPDNATNKAVTWASDNTSIATVDSNGKVTAVAAGTANITVTTTDGSKTATCAVTVNAATVAVTGVTLDKTTATLTVGGGTETLTATVKPDNATDKTVTWTSSNESVATVANGVVTPVAAGSATITAKAGDKTATCTVTVNAATYTVTVNTPTNGSVSASPTSAAAGAEVTLTVTPASGYELDTLTVKDGSNNDVTVTDNKFTMPASNVAVSATFKASSSSTVAVSGITINNAPTEALFVNSTGTLTATVSPDNATDKTVTWSSSDPDYVSINETTGEYEVKGTKGYGSATITATASGGSGVTATCTITGKVTYTSLSVGTVLHTGDTFYTGGTVAFQTSPLVSFAASNGVITVVEDTSGSSKCYKFQRGSNGTMPNVTTYKVKDNTDGVYITGGSGTTQDRFTLAVHTAP